MHWKYDIYLLQDQLCWSGISHRSNYCQAKLNYNVCVNVWITSSKFARDYKLVSSWILCESRLHLRIIVSYEWGAALKLILKLNGMDAGVDSAAAVRASLLLGFLMFEWLASRVLQVQVGAFTPWPASSTLK